MKRTKTELEIMGEELITLAKCIEYFKSLNKKYLTASLRPEYILILENLGYKISTKSDGEIELHWD